MASIRLPHPSAARRRRLLASGMAAMVTLGGCAGHAPLPPAAAGLRAGPGQALLLGEVHDNAAQHALRRDLLAALLVRGDRPALLLEQFDRERQAALDAAIRSANQPGSDRAPAALEAQVDAVVQAGGAAPGWHWPFYTPYIRLALAHGLPIVAANVSRAEARVVMQQGLAASGFDAVVPEDIARAQAAAIEASHCGQLTAAQAARLALAQVARDQFMARLVAQHAERGVVLLAGNGHVRSDIGVPRWLPPALRARTLAVGTLEAGSTDPAPYDTVLHTAAQQRPDPCAGLRMPAAGR